MSENERETTTAGCEKAREPGAYNISLTPDGATNGTSKSNGANTAGAFPGGKHYRTFDAYLKERFGCKVVKIGLDGGFTCPNRDGSKGIGGCAFCVGGGAETAGNRLLPLKTQYEQGRTRLEAKWGRPKTIPYFQSYTSTYAPLDRLRSLYEEALSFEDAVGLSVATRPDALPDEVLDYLAEIARRTFLTVELGLQTVHDVTAEKVNRGYRYEEFLAAFEALRKRQIPICVHLLDGLPGESAEMMLESACRVGALRPEFIKFHALYIRRDAALAESYLRGEFSLLTREEYLSVLARQLAFLPRETVIERLTGDPEKSALLAPAWTCDKKKVLAGLDRELANRAIFQGVWA